MCFFHVLLWFIQESDPSEKEKKATTSQSDSDDYGKDVEFYQDRQLSEKLIEGDMLTPVGSGVSFCYFCLNFDVQFLRDHEKYVELYQDMQLYKEIS